MKSIMSISNKITRQELDNRLEQLAPTDLKHLAQRLGIEPVGRFNILQKTKQITLARLVVAWNSPL